MSVKREDIEKSLFPTKEWEREDERRAIIHAMHLFKVPYRGRKLIFEALNCDKNIFDWFEDSDGATFVHEPWPRRYSPYGLAHDYLATISKLDGEYTKEEVIENSLAFRDICEMFMVEPKKKESWFWGTIFSGLFLKK